MMFLSAIVFQIPPAIQSKIEKGVFGVKIDDRIESGFAIGGGKYLITCDHVVGSSSTITILEPKAESRKGFLVFHDAKLNVAVYRMDRLSSFSFLISDNSKRTLNPSFVLDPMSRAQVGGVMHNGDLSKSEDKDNLGRIRFLASIGQRFRGGPVINSTGEVLGMVQGADLTTKEAFFGVSTVRLAQFLRDQTVSPLEATVVGNLGQALDRTGVFSSASSDSSPLFMTNRNQLLVVNDYSPEFLRVTLSNGGTGYVATNMVSIVSRNVTLGDYGIANGREVIRAVQAFDIDSLKASSSESEWRAETIRFVGSIFETVGREISADVSVQLDIGRSVATVDDLRIGDRLYFGKGKELWAAIYLGDDQYISVSRLGKLVTTKFGTTESKPFSRALH